MRILTSTTTSIAGMGTTISTAEIGSTREMGGSTILPTAEPLRTRAGALLRDMAERPVARAYKDSVQAWGAEWTAADHRRIAAWATTDLEMALATTEAGTAPVIAT